MLERHTTSFIQMHILHKSGQFLLQKSEVASPVRQPSKMKGPICWSSRAAHHTLTLKRSWKLLSAVAWEFSTAHTWVVCIIATIAIELHLISKQDVTMQLVTAIEPLAKFQPLNKITRSKMLHLLHVVWIHAHCMLCYPHSYVGNTKMSCISLHTRTWTALYHLNNAFFIDAFINITLSCNANAGKCTGISQCLVNSSKHSSGWYSTVQKTSLIFSYGMNWITITTTVHINHICILCNWKCKWHREHNRRTKMRIHTGLTGTLHCHFYCPHL